MITANGFVKTGSDSSHVLLGDGSHELLSNLSNSHSHAYLPLAGSTMDSSAQIIIGSITHSDGVKYSGGIQLREKTYSGVNFDGTNYYEGPGITFHWGGRWVHLLNMHSNALYWDNSQIWNSSNTYVNDNGYGYIGNSKITNVDYASSTGSVSWTNVTTGTNNQTLYLDFPSFVFKDKSGN